MSFTWARTPLFWFCLWGYDKALTKSTVGRKGWIWVTGPNHRPSWMEGRAEPEEDPGVRNWRGGHEVTLITDLLPMVRSAQPALLYPQDHLPRDTRPITGCPLLQHLQLRKRPHTWYGWMWRRWFPTEAPSSLVCHMTRKTTGHSLSCPRYALSCPRTGRAWCHTNACVSCKGVSGMHVCRSGCLSSACVSCWGVSGVHVCRSGCLRSACV